MVNKYVQFVKYNLFIVAMQRMSNAGNTSLYCVRRELISGQIVSLLINSTLIACGSHWIS